ncbi:hypothetical protein B0A48_07600 [Cryoendolithus antarcticus]|uniref:Uncharacterized protein n=1 Tax=Cryoendolithus antarcticus TaxID=1507870 RepID=A0A1V8T6W5_9PEZI|nr:hypothetical protein B0A48_07600 [Cryoendolithus antarcticus]
MPDKMQGTGVLLDPLTLPVGVGIWPYDDRGVEAAPEPGILPDIDAETTDDEPYADALLPAGDAGPLVLADVLLEAPLIPEEMADDVGLTTADELGGEDEVASCSAGEELGEAATPDDVLEDCAEDEEDAAEDGGVYAGGDTATDVLNGILVVIPAPEEVEVAVDEAAEVVELADSRDELVEAMMEDVGLDDGEAPSKADELVDTEEVDEDFELDGDEVVIEELVEDVDVVEAPAGEPYAGGPAELPLLLETTDDDDRLHVEEKFIIAEEDVVELLALLVLMTVLLLLDGTLYPGGVAAPVDERLDVLGVELELPDLELELVATLDVLIATLDVLIATLDVLIAIEVVLLVVAPGDEYGGGIKELVELAPELVEREEVVDEAVVDVP